MHNTNPNEIQHGGEHYKQAGNAQHWDMLPIAGFGWEYYLGCATKYLTRVKDQEHDPKKAAHFVDKLIFLVENSLVPERFRTVQGKRLTDSGNTPYNQRVDIESWLLDVYFPANNLDKRSPQALAILQLMLALTAEDLYRARRTIGEILGEAGSGYVNQDAAPAPSAAARLEAALEAAEKPLDDGFNKVAAETEATLTPGDEPRTVAVQGD